MMSAKSAFSSGKPLRGEASSRDIFFCGQKEADGEDKDKAKVKQGARKRSKWMDRLRKRAAEALSHPPAALPQSSSSLESLVRRFWDDPQQLEAFLAEPALQTSIDTLSEKQDPLLRTIAALGPDSPEKRAGLLISQAGVGPGKLAQILANNDKLLPNIRESLRTVQSSGAPSRSLSEAQDWVDKLYGRGKYVLTALAGVGTIGETYLGMSRRDEQPIVIKMLKKGVNRKTLEAEWEIARYAIEKYVDDEATRSFELNRLDNLYAQWGTELNFQQEADGAAALLEGATRYKVAQSKEVGYRPGMSEAESLVLEKAEGISLDKLTSMLEVYRKDPQRYIKQYGKEIAEHPWLVRPEDWMEQLPSVYRDAHNEQIFLRINKGKKTVSHGDPHAGNVFVTYDAESKRLIPTYIDTGLTVSRTSKQAINHLGFFTHMMTGNSQRVAESIADMTDLQSGSREAVVRELAQELDSRLFRASVNVTDISYNSALIEMILRKHGVLIPENETTFLKAQLQTVSTYKELSELTGQSGNSYMQDSLPDMRTGIFRLLRQEPRESMRHIGSTMQHLLTDGENALSTMFQFLLKHKKKNAE